ncbi:MAG: DUF4328 domain-containing protein [Campylobacteraceae bacterium]|jgi:hypothetical protein|nr:DUF4328 domain-containing protein [Campylobacteraceae bacterium]
MQNRPLSNRRIANVAIFFTWAMLIVYFFQVILNYIYEVAGPLFVAEDMSAFLKFTALYLVATLSIVVFIIIYLIIFLVWFYRAYANLHEVNAMPKYSKSWAVWSWIIPIVNFYLPFQILKEMYAKTAQLLSDSPERDRLKNGVPTVNIFWALFLICIAFDIVYFVSIFPDLSVFFDISMFILLVPAARYTAKIIDDYAQAEEQLLSEKGFIC